jgi:hypothetical protein
LTNGALTQQVSLVGLFFNGSTTLANNTINNNLIHSLSLSTNNALATITGMQMNAGAFSVVNNMIRLGLDSDGNSISNNYSIRGINHIPVTANSAYYYNTVYVGGTGVDSGTNPTYAFFRAAASGNIFIKNNIFYNARSNGAGTGSHFAIGIANMTGISGVNVDYNYYHAGGTGGNIGQDVSNTRTLLSDWQSVLPNLDANSIFGTLTFVNATGNASNVDLHIDPSVGTQVESAGTTVGV